MSARLLLHVVRRGGAPIIVASELPVEQAVARLQAATGRLTVRLRNSPAVVGTVAEDKVRLQRLRPFDGNYLKPFFVGRFFPVQGKSELRGVFTMHWLTKLLLVLWFAFWEGGTLLAFDVDGRRGEPSLVRWLGLGMLSLCAGLVAWGKWLSRDDPAYLSNFIEAALLGPASSPPAEPKPSAVNRGNLEGPATPPAAAPTAVHEPRRGASASVTNNEPVDALIAELVSVADESRLNDLLRKLDEAADPVRWFVDKDYASVALADAALGVPSPSRRQKMLGHALYRARTYASFATSGGEGMARMNEVDRLEALLRDGT